MVQCSPRAQAALLHGSLNITDATLDSVSRYYLTRYSSDMSVVWLQQNSTASAEKFTQTIHRVKQQFTYHLPNAIKLTGGLGAGMELMNDNAYTSGGSMHTQFVYLQAYWQLHPIPAWRQVCVTTAITTLVAG